MNKKFLASDNSDFSDIIKQSCYYVDKTHLIYQIASRNIGTSVRYYFLSRPRRFGKSLLIDTFHCLFEGKKQLFKDLYIYEKWDFEANTHPVIRMDFAGKKYQAAKDLENRIHGILELIELKHQLPDLSNSSDYTSRLEQIFFYIFQKHNKKIVVLIDEYDKPVLDVLSENQKLAKSNTQELSGFFSALKANQQYIRFVFITGISMFPLSQMQSGLNNVDDISLDHEYSTICGFTEKELKTVFAPELKKLKEISFDNIKNHYNGYGWCGEQKTRVYNPYSIILLFAKKKLRPWWYRSCAPSFFYNILKNFYVTPFEIGSNLENEESLITLDIDKINVQALFFQMGVLTIVGERFDQAKKKTLYLLDYPNEEIREAFTEGVMSTFFTKENYAVSPSKARIIVNQLKNKEFSKLRETLEALYADIPFPWIANIQESDNKNKLDKETKLRVREGFFSGFLFSGLDALSIKVNKETISLKGISDLEIELGNQVFILELKILRIKDIDESLQNALDQIVEKRYGARHFYADKKVYGIAMVFDQEKSNIVGLEHKVLFEGKLRT